MLDDMCTHLDHDLGTIGCPFNATILPMLCYRFRRPGQIRQYSCRLDSRLVSLGVSTRSLSSRTRTFQTERPFLVNVQKRDLRGLAVTQSTGSGVTWVRVGTVESCLAAETGKYMIWIRN